MPLATEGDERISPESVEGSIIHIHTFRLRFTLTFLHGFQRVGPVQNCRLLCSKSDFIVGIFGQIFHGNLEKFKCADSSIECRNPLDFGMKTNLELPVHGSNYEILLQNNQPVPLVLFRFVLPFKTFFEMTLTMSCYPLSYLSGLSCNFVFCVRYNVCGISMYIYCKCGQINLSLKFSKLQDRKFSTDFFFHVHQSFLLNCH